MDLLKIKINKISLLNKQEQMYEILNIHPFKRLLFILFFITFGFLYSSIFFTGDSGMIVLYVMMSYLTPLLFLTKKTITYKKIKGSGLNLLEFNEKLNYEILSGKKNLKFYEYIYYFLSITSFFIVLLQLGEMISNFVHEKRLKIDLKKIEKEKNTLIKEMLSNKEMALYIVKNKYNLNIMAKINASEYIIDLINKEYLTEKERMLVSDYNKNDANLNIYLLEQRFEKEKYIPTMKKEKHIKIQNN